MKKIILIIIVVAGIFALAASYDFYLKPDKMTLVSTEETVEKNIKIAPDVCLKTIANDTCLYLSELKGKVVIINFWASWCVPCIVEFPFLLETVERFKGDVALVMISIDTRIEDIEKFKTRFTQKFEDVMNGKSVYWIHDADQSLSNNIFGVYKVPETIIIDKKSRMRRKITGQVDKYAPPFHDIISKLLSTDL